MERLKTDLARDETLLEELERLGGEPEVYARWARARGYELTPDQARELLHHCLSPSEEDLEMVAGGWADGNSGRE